MCSTRPSRAHRGARRAADGRPGALSLYQEEWTKLLDMADDIQAFMRSNAASLKTKS